MNQGSNFLGGSLSNKDDVRAPIQTAIESQPQHDLMCDALRDLVPFVQFKKREKHP